MSGNFSGPGPAFGGFPGVATAVLICGAVGAFLGKLEYGRIGLIAYGIAGGVVGLLATAWDPPVSGLGAGLGYGLTFLP